MKKYEKEQITLGVELEIADIDTTIKIPEELGKWDYDDYTIVNSSGIGNDPKKKMVRWGGEINTQPTYGAEKQIKIIENIFNLFDKKSLNYTCNLHIHASIDGLKEDLNLLKNITKYFFEYQFDIFKITEDLQTPCMLDFSNIEEFNGAMKRYKRRKVSHQYPLNEKQVKQALQAKTYDEFFNAFKKYTNYLKRKSWIYVKRPGINIFQIDMMGTIEFRHFSMTFDLDLFYNCLKWVEEVFFASIQTQENPYDIFKRLGKPKFPSFLPYNHNLQKIFDLTHFGKLSRKEIKQNLLMLLKQKKISLEDIGYDITKI